MEAAHGVAPRVHTRVVHSVGQQGAQCGEWTFCRSQEKESETNFCADPENCQERLGQLAVAILERNRNSLHVHGFS